MVRLLRPRCRRFPLSIKTRVLIGLEDQLATNRYWWAELSLCRFTSTPSFGEPSVLLHAARFPVNWVKEELFVQAHFSLAKIRNRLIRARFSRTVGISWGVPSALQWFKVFMPSYFFWRKRWRSHNKSLLLLDRKRSSSFSQLLKAMRGRRKSKIM